MIRSFRHAGLGLLYHSGLSHGVPADRVPALVELLALVDVAEDIHDLALPGLQVMELHREPVVAVSLAWRRPPVRQREAGSTHGARPAGPAGSGDSPPADEAPSVTWCLTLFCFQGDAFEVNLFDYH